MEIGNANDKENFFFLRLPFYYINIGSRNMELDKGRY